MKEKHVLDFILTLNLFVIFNTSSSEIVSLQEYKYTYKFCVWNYMKKIVERSLHLRISSKYKKLSSTYKSMEH